MLGSARGRRAIARGAQIAAFAASAIMALSVMPAAEPATNGRVGAGAGAGTIEGALVLAYRNNPQLNAQRSSARATDENVPTALAGYRPRVTGTSSLTEQYLDNLTKTGTTPGGAALYTQSQGAAAVSSFGLTTTQTLFNGFQTANRTRQAEGQVSSARELLRSTEQGTLLNAATAYMNLLQTAAILELQRSNVNVLEVTLRQTRDRFTAGEVTRTDVAQAESRLAAGRSQLSLAECESVTAQAQYQQVIGVPAPARLAPAAPVDRLSPRTLDGAISRGRPEHPPMTRATYNVEIAVQQVKIAEGALYPTLSAVGNVQKTFGSTGSPAILETLSASVGAQPSVAIAQHAAGRGQDTRGTRHRATRPGGGVVYGAGGDRHAFTSASGDDRGGVTRVAGSAGAGRGRLLYISTSSVRLSTPKRVKAVIASSSGPRTVRRPASGYISLQISCNQSSSSPSILATRAIVKT